MNCSAFDALLQLVAMSHRPNVLTRAIKSSNLKLLKHLLDEGKFADNEDWEGASSSPAAILRRATYAHRCSRARSQTCVGARPCTTPCRSSSRLSPCVWTRSTTTLSVRATV